MFSKVRLATKLFGCFAIVLAMMIGFGIFSLSMFIAGIGKVRGKVVILVATHHLFTFDQVATLAAAAAPVDPS